MLYLFIFYFIGVCVSLETEFASHSVHPSHLRRYTHKHTIVQVELHSEGPAPSKWIAGHIDFFFFS